MANDDARPLDFIRKVVADDLASGKHDRIVTRFTAALLYGENI